GGCPKKVHQAGNHAPLVAELGQRDDGLVELQALAVEEFVGAVEQGDLLGTEAAALQTLAIDGAGGGRVARHHHVGGHILGEEGGGPGKAVGADRDELVHQHVAGEDRPVPHHHMAGEGGIVDQDAVIAHHAIVTDVDVGHQQVVIADGGLAPILHGAAVDGDPLADDVVVADHQPRGFALVLEVRGVLPHGGKLVDAVMGADHGGALDDHVGADLGIVADGDVRADDGPGTHLDVGADAGGRVDNGARINQNHRPQRISCRAHSSCASQASWSSTVALQLKRQILRFTESISACSISRSPGTTWRLKRTPSTPAKRYSMLSSAPLLTVAKPSTPEAWAMASIIITPGKIGALGKWPLNTSS